MVGDGTPAVGLAPPYLRLREIRKTFGRFAALEQVSLDVAPGEFVSFLGPSGCGKTTLLRIVAGLEEPDRGSVTLAGRDVTRLPPARRDLGIVFQSYALFPNLTAAQNVAYGLESRRVPKAERNHRVRELLELVGLPDAGSKYPAQLSGGMQQRVALARALALSPKLLLLDEPLSALDAQVRASLRGEITRLHRRLGVTTVMVTHDQVEALTMADRVVVMDQGRIIQSGTPREIYEQPATPFVTQFVGQMNFLHCVTDAPSGSVRCGTVTLLVSEGLSGASDGSQVTLAIRPEDVRLSHCGNGPTGAGNTLNARVEKLEFLGPPLRASVRLDGALPLTVDLPTDAARSLSLTEGEHVQVRLPAERLRVFASENISKAS